MKESYPAQLFINCFIMILSHYDELTQGDLPWNLRCVTYNNLHTLESVVERRKSLHEISICSNQTINM